MLKKVIGTTCALFFVFLAAAGSYFYYRLKVAIPSYEGELVLDVLEAPVQVEHFFKWISIAWRPKGNWPN